jgi:hypothetical protein
VEPVITRAWAMPDSSTFQIPPIAALIANEFRTARAACDPFVNNSPFKYRCVTNDVDPDIEADFTMDALDFLRTRADREFDLVLFDPPYSPRQVAEVYKKVGRTVNLQTTQASFWGDLKREIRRVLALGGCVVSCGWNSGGVGGPMMQLERVLLVAHGGYHNDTIVTVERKMAEQLFLY